MVGPKFILMLEMNQLTLPLVIFLFLTCDSAEENNYEFLQDKCSNFSSEDCLKMDALETIANKLAHRRSIKLFPGLTLEAGGYQSHLEKNETDRSSVSFDKFISEDLQPFFSSLSLKIKIMDIDAVDKITRLSSGLTSLDDSRGMRRRNNVNANATLTMALISAVMMLAVALSGLAAMAGKALAMSMLSVTLSMMNHNHGHSHGGWNGNHGKAVEVHHTHTTSIGSLPTHNAHKATPPNPHDPYKSTSDYIK